jgi:hypothetical protein
MLHIAHITQTRPLQGFVVNTADLQVAVHCQHDGEAWEPLFGIKRGVGRISLPSCFRLSDESIAALDAAARDNHPER